jgi:hypothetical protein
MISNLDHVSPNILQSSKAIITHSIKHDLQQQFKSFWHAKLHNDSASQNGNKLRHYRTLKHHFVKENYLNSINQHILRKKLANLRLSSHSLNIETGRYVQGVNRLPPEERLCVKCDLKKCENEFHFVIECPYYTSLRESMLSVMSKKYAFISTYNNIDKYHWLICNQDDFVNYHFAKFLKDAFKLRGQ